MGIKSVLRPAVRISRRLGLIKAAYFAMKPFSHKKIKLSSESARKKLEEFSPPQNGTSRADNALIKPYKYDLQIIIPAYNVENYLAECVNSVLDQKTEYSYRVIIIDDGSTDKTGAIADSFANNPKCEIIHQENQGLSGARNAGLKNINAKYVMFVDSDDKLTGGGAVQALLAAAFKYDADIVQGGHNTLLGNVVKDLGKKYKKLEFLKADGKFGGWAWGKIFRGELFEKIKFPEKYWFEDSIMSFLIYPVAEKTLVIPDIIYSYRMNSAGITQTAANKKKSVDTYWITELLMHERENFNLPVDETYYKKIIRQIILNYARTRKQCIFELTSGLFEKYFKEEYKYKKYIELERAFRSRDFGQYRLYCLTHHE